MATHSILTSLLFNIILEALAQEIRQEKEIKGIQIGKEIKLSIFANDMLLYIRDSQNCIRKVLERISNFNKVVGKKINLENISLTNTPRKRSRAHSYLH